MQNNAISLGVPPPRHYGLDWLRIGAFAILIGYHSLLPFSPHSWVVKSDQIAEWLMYVMEAISPWRLEVLFLVSGYATQAMLSRQGNLNAFAWLRSRRLLIPLLFGIAFIVPPQSWTALSVRGDYSGGFLSFWPQVYFSFSSATGLFLPQVQHLWFLGYLWFYTMLFLIYVRLFPVPEWPTLLNRKHLLLLIPAALLGLGRVLVIGFYGEEHHFFDDWLSHLHYLSPFVLGVMLARNPQVWSVVSANMAAAFALGIAAYFVAVTIEMIEPDPHNWNRTVAIIFYMTDSTIAWSIMLGMAGLAHRLLNQDHHWRLPLSRAIFPAYIVHQTVIVLMAGAFVGSAVPALLQWLSIISVTTLSCISAYLIGKVVPPLGMLIGLEPSVTAKPQRAAANASR